MAVKKKKKLSPNQLKFVDFYVQNSHITEAAIKAGYSKKTAYSVGSRLLKNDEISKLVEIKKNEISKKISKKTEISLERILKELGRIAFVDVKDLAEWDGTDFNLFDSKDLGSVSKTIKKLTSVINKRYEHGKEVGSTCRVSVETYDKLKALEMISKLLGFWVDKNEHAGPNGAPISVTPVEPAEIVKVVRELMEGEGRKFE